MTKEYFINSETLILIPVGKEDTKVYETDSNFVVESNTMNLVNKSCKYFGSNYQGRYDASKSLLKMNYKLPIIVDDYKELIFFPSSSPRLDDCHWIALHNIEGYDKNDQKTTITFKNGLKYDLNMSYGSFENQVFRATMLLMIIKKRKSR